jgi:hypothetical protein
MCVGAQTRESMNSAPTLAHIIGRRLLATAALMDAGTWCFVCQDIQDDVCREGKCLEAEMVVETDFEAFQHEPAADWGGGE